MDWGQVLTIIFGIAGFMSIFMLLVNKRIDDLRQDIDRRFENLEKEMDRRFNELKEEQKEIKQELKEIRQLLYKVLGVENKKES
ncbi:hypothetical protein JCM9492_07240 [Aquifex pyrophilus]